MASRDGSVGNTSVRRRDDRVISQKQEILRHVVWFRSSALPACTPMATATAWLAWLNTSEHLDYI